MLGWSWVKSGGVQGLSQALEMQMAKGTLMPLMEEGAGAGPGMAWFPAASRMRHFCLKATLSQVWCSSIREPWQVRWSRGQSGHVPMQEMPRSSLTCPLCAGDLVAEVAGAKPPVDSLMCSG